MNTSILVVGYGSLLSGYGLLAERRGGRSRLLARDAVPVIIDNAVRGLAKPSSHGDYLAMDLEPVDTTIPITVRTAIGGGGPGEVGGLLLEFDREWADKIARREEYDSATFLRLIEMADRTDQPLGDFLFEVARIAAFDFDVYRRELRKLLGYTSPGYIFHPVPLEDGRVAVVAIGSGYRSSGDPAIVSRRRECEMDKLLTIGQALGLSKLAIHREGQVGYFAEALLGGMHGVPVGDLMAGFDRDSVWADQLAEHFRLAARKERENFLRATSLTENDYRARFEGPSPSLIPLLKHAGLA